MCESVTSLRIDGKVDAMSTSPDPGFQGGTGYLLAMAGAAAMGNWVFDCGCLTLSFLAVGAGVPWRGLLLAYGAGQLATTLPITPGGLGVVEGSLTVALVTFGEPQTGQFTSERLTCLS